MTGKIVLGLFGLLVVLYGSVWQWKLIGAVLALAGFGAAVAHYVQRRQPR